MYSALVVLLPFLVGFLAGVSGIWHEQKITPAWVHQARMALSWIVVILVYARLAIVQRDRLLLHAATVALLGWLFFGVLYFLILRLLDLFPGIPKAAPLTFFGAALEGLVIDVIRAVVGTVLGLALVRAKRRSIQPAA